MLSLNAGHLCQWPLGSDAVTCSGVMDPGWQSCHLVPKPSLPFETSNCFPSPNTAAPPACHAAEFGSRCPQTHPASGPDLEIFTRSSLHMHLPTQNLSSMPTRPPTYTWTMKAKAHREICSCSVAHYTCALQLILTCSKDASEQDIFTLHETSSRSTCCGKVLRQV